MRMVVIAALVALAGCLQQTGDEKSDGAAAAAGPCVAAASRDWAPEGGPPFKVEATSAGPDCQHAVATITIRNAANDIYWVEAYPASQVMSLAAARTLDEMQAALLDWTDSANSTIVTSSALPDWPANTDGPENGEFPFYIAEGMDRGQYMSIRQQNVPVFCYVQGMESLNCLAYLDGGLTVVGIQSFPG